MRNLGLIGGLGPGATVHYYQELAKAQAGEMLIVHADIEHVLSAVARGDRVALAAYLARLIERLAEGGADFAAISAITPHICIRELERISALPLINIIDEVRTEIRARGYKKVAIFGTRFVVESRMFGMLDDVEAIVPDQVDAIHEAYMGIVDGSSRDGLAVLTRIAQTLPVDAIILGGTDLSMGFQAGAGFPLIDAAKLQIEAIGRKLRE